MEVSAVYNTLLDALPEDFEGWLIRTDFRIGVQLQLCLSDPELLEAERAAVAFRLLFGNGLPDLDTARRGLVWFMACGNPPEGPAEDEGPEEFSFDLDAGRIFSAFYKVYGLDLSRARLHWFQFVSLLGDLSGTAFTGVMDIRATPLTDVEARRRAEFARMKRRFALHPQYTEEEETRIRDFLDQLNQPREIQP